MSSLSPASRRLILILAVSAFAGTFSGRAMEPLTGLLASDFGVRVDTVALLSAAFAIPYAIGQPFLGPVGDALGKERVMKACLAVLCLSLFASVFVTSLEALFALRMLAGVAAGGVTPLNLAIIGDRVEMSGRQVALSRYVVWLILGQMAGSSVSGLIAAYVGWRGVLALATALMVASLVSVLIGFRDVERGSPFRLGVALERYGEILRNRRALALFAFVFLEAVAVFGLFPYIAPILEQLRAGGVTEAGLVLGAFAVGGVVYSFAVRWILSRHGLGRMLVAGGILSGLALVAIGVATGWPAQAGAMVVLGLGFYMLHNSFQTQVTEVAPNARATAVALHPFSFFVGQALGVVAVGFGLRAFGLLATSFIAGGIILAVGLAAAAVLATPQPRAR
jgi:predicted MFS family arabinose efflux permease